MNDLGWGPLGLMLLGIYSVRCMVITYRLRPVTEHLMFMVTSIVFIVLQLVTTLSHIKVLKLFIQFESAIDILTTLTLSSMLSSLALVVRESKPIVSRFPILLAFLPFLLVPAHALVSHTFVLKQMLYTVYETGALLVALLIYGLKASNNDRYRTLLFGMIPFGLALILPWLDTPFLPSPWTEWTLFGIGLILIPKLYKSIIRHDYDHPDWRHRT